MIRTRPSTEARSHGLGRRRRKRGSGKSATVDGLGNVDSEDDFEDDAPDESVRKSLQKINRLGLGDLVSYLFDDSHDRYQSDNRDGKTCEPNLTSLENQRMNSHACE